MKKRIKKELYEFSLLMHSTPTYVAVLFAASVFSMNLFANKSINMPFSWMALDTGIIFSWVAFLAMDILTKHFGPKAATEISIFSVAVNLLLCFMFYIGSVIPGVWSESCVEGSESIINAALNNTFGGTWYVLLGSTAAIIVSSFVNNFLNHAIGTAFKKNPDGIAAYISRTYLSTAVGQLTDNLVFALLVSRNFFGWTLTQCVVCSLTGMLAELLFEAVFSPIGYKICKSWKKNSVGREYLSYRGQGA